MRFLSLCAVWLFPHFFTIFSFPPFFCLTNVGTCLWFQQTQLSPGRQAELHSDLKIQEKDELQWKMLKAEGLDEDGEKEARLRRNFNGGSHSADLTTSWFCPEFTEMSHCVELFNVNIINSFTRWKVLMFVFINYSLGSLHECLHALN